MTRSLIMVQANPSATEIEQRQTAIYRSMTPQQRLSQALRMNRTMRELMAAGYRARHPAWTETDIQRAVAARILHANTG